MSPPAEGAEVTLLIVGANVADKPLLIVDVTIVYAFHGACDNVGRYGGGNGAKRFAQNQDRVLIDTAKRKVSRYRLDYLQQDKAFLPLVASTSGRWHAEFIRLLYFLAHRSALAF